MTLRLILFCLMIYLVGCKNDNNNGNNSTSQTPGAVGTQYQGGIIAYILQPGDPGYVSSTIHGLIVAPTVGTATWGCPSTVLGNTSQSFGSGMANTNNIVAGCSTPDIAARICSDLVISGYDDWYLPSYNELARILSNASSIGGFVDNAGYWTSSESASGAIGLGLTLPPGSFVVFVKSWNNSYRAVRSF